MTRVDKDSYIVLISPRNKKTTTS